MHQHKEKLAFNLYGYAIVFEICDMFTNGWLLWLGGAFWFCIK